MPVVHFEELLCKEAMLLSKHSSDEDISSEDLVSIRCIKISFACLIRSHHCARWCLIKLQPSLSFSFKSEGTKFCSICKRDCYVSRINCSCHTDPICLFHGIEYTWVSHYFFVCQGVHRKPLYILSTLQVANFGLCHRCWGIQMWMSEQLCS